MPAEFIRAQAEDAPALVAIQIAAFHHDSVIYPGIEPDGPPGYTSVEVMLEKIARDVCYKIISDGQLVGGLVIFLREDGSHHLDVIFIHPDYHNQGIGTQAMRFIEVAHPAAKWTLDTPQWAVRNRHFYEKLGYVIVEEFDYEGFPLVAYEKHARPLDG
jgi:GNAT superfamily N-acetyltransferase